MPKQEIKSLALADLDIAELDRRIELAPAAAAAEWGCSTNCGVDCPQVCTEFLICEANVFKP
ncbi:MAG: hypothetical protein ABI678_03170 [Kofleriaceae bacterium]